MKIAITAGPVVSKILTDDGEAYQVDVIVTKSEDTSSLSIPLEPRSGQLFARGVTIAEAMERLYGALQTMLDGEFGDVVGPHGDKPQPGAN